MRVSRPEILGKVFNALMGKGHHPNYVRQGSKYKMRGLLTPRMYKRLGNVNGKSGTLLRIYPVLVK
jgi:hypothetical protein